jgi:hypothetical protein
MSTSADCITLPVTLTTDLIAQVKAKLAGKPGISMWFSSDLGWFDNDTCAFCRKALTGAVLHTQEAWAEYCISGMCQSCQDE